MPRFGRAVCVLVTDPDAPTPPLGMPAAARLSPPPITTIPADPSNYRHGGANRPIDLIVIHCTDGHADALPVAQMWRTPHHGSSAHFVIGQDGAIIQAVGLDDIAWHAHAANGTSIGIEHCARTPRELGPDDPGLAPSQVQLDASARLVAWLCASRGIPCDRAHVMGHAEADRATTHTLCPTGAGFDLNVMVAAARALMPVNVA